MLENFGFRQLTVWWRVRAFWEYLRGDLSWGAMERRGVSARHDLATPESDQPSKRSGADRGRVRRQRGGARRVGRGRLAHRCRGADSGPAWLPSNAIQHRLGIHGLWRRPAGGGAGAAPPHRAPGRARAAMGLATLAEYLFRANLGIDDLLVETYVLTGVSNPGRMAPNSAVALALVGAALLCLSYPSVSRVRHLFPALLGSVVIAIGTAALVGYAAEIPGAYGWGHFNRMSIHTAFGFIMLGGGVVGLAWNAARAQSSEAPPWLPSLAAVAVITVTLCMWYALGGAPPIHLDPPPAPATKEHALPNITLAAGLVSALLLAWSVRAGQTTRRHAHSLEVTNQALNEEIQVRARMEETLQRLAAIVEFSDDAILATDPDGLILTWNPGAERLYGYTRDEVLGKHVSLLHTRKELEADLLDRLRNGGRVSQMETVKLTKDGREIDVSLTISLILDRKGRSIGGLENRKEHYRAEAARPDEGRVRGHRLS